MLLSQGESNFNPRGNTNVKKLAPKKPLEHTTPCVMSAAQVRHGLRRLLRVARRLDGDRIQLRSLLPVAGAHLPSSIDDDAWDGKEKKTSVRSVVLGAVREASGDVSARPEGVRAMSRNAAALEAVIARADLATRAEAAFLASASDEPEAAATSTSSHSSMSTSRAPSRETRLARLRGWRHLKDVLREHPEVAHRISKPRADMMRLVRAAIDSTLAQASTSRLMELGASTSENDEDETGEWLRHASRTTLAARRDRAKRRAEARRIARQDPVTQWTTEAHMIDPDDQTIDDDDDDLTHPNRIFYEGRLDATLDASASKKPDDTPDDILALFREMHAVGCPPNRRMYIRAMRGVARRGRIEKDVNDDPMKNSEPGSERALRLLWMLAHRSRGAAEAGLRATPMGLGGVFSFQTVAMSVGVRKAGSTGVVGLDGLCEGFGDAICEALLEAASNEGNEGSQTTRAHERALAAMGALTDLGAAPGTRTANDVLVAVCRAFAKNESQNMNAKNIADAQSAVVTNQRRFRRVMDAALRAERHGSGLESSTWHALIECAERRGTLDDAFDCVLEFHAR